MPFEAGKQVYNAAVGTLEIGTGSAAVSLGGQNVWPLYAFDGPIANPPRIGVEVSDLGVGAWSEGIQNYYADCADVVAIAEKAAAIPGAGFIYLVFNGADPAEQDRSIADCVALAQAVVEKSPIPVAIAGSGNQEKDVELLEQLAEALSGKNVLFFSAKEETYKALGAAIALAWGQKLVGESAVDINLAKQLNLLLSQLGVQNSSLAMNIGSAAAGYGFEYITSTIERVKGAALTQNDTSLQVPIITPVGADAWNTKEALLDEADNPIWGSREERGIEMEIVTASATLASGSDAVIMRHPEAITTIARFIDLLTKGGE
jgi:acetyl-CoA decarbonylase/synthase complex subunit delta